MERAVKVSRGRIVLHVGAPKTGSTYLQKRLRCDAVGLRAQGVYVPVLPLVKKMAGNAKLLATLLSDDPSLSFRRVFPEIEIRRLDPAMVVEDLLRDWDRACETVILSAENFRPSHAKRLAAILPKDTEIIVVLFVRKQDDWLNSYYSQLIKTRDTQKMPGCFVNEVFEQNTDRFCFPDWHEHYETWRTTFDKCNVVFFEESNSDLYDAFCRAAALTPSPTLPDIPKQQISLDQNQLCYLLMLDADLPFDEFVRRRSAAQIAAQQFAAPRAQLLDPSLHARVAARFKASNARLLAAIGRRPEDPVLRLAEAPVEYISIADLARSPDFLRYRRFADKAYDSGRAIDARPLRS